MSKQSVYLSVPVSISVCLCLQVSLSFCQLQIITNNYKLILLNHLRKSSIEINVRKCFTFQVWYNVEGFLDKNRDTLRYDVMGLLIGSKV